jgi:carbonic anhydrase
MFMAVGNRLCALSVAVGLLCAVLAGCGGGSDDASSTVEGPVWNHDPGDDTAGPAGWGKVDPSFQVCTSGDRQSPVDLAGAKPADLPELEFNYPPTPFVLKNTGHVIEASLPAASELTLTIGDAEYRLVRFQFHAPSEHTVAGQSYEAELQLVHRSAAGELAVVAILLEPSGLPSPLITQVIDRVPGKAGQEVEFDEGLSPLQLFLEFEAPPRGVVERYYTYPGSLTMPPCTEGVRWMVLEDILVIRPNAVRRLGELIGGFPGYDGSEGNNRPTQPLNGREIERSN